MSLLLLRSFLTLVFRWTAWSFVGDCEVCFLSLKVIYIPFFQFFFCSCFDRSQRQSPPARYSSVKYRPPSNFPKSSQLRRVNDLKMLTVAALVGLLAFADAAHNHGHAHLHRSHNHSDLEKRGGQCQFPTDAGLVSVTPGSQNAGWAMSPDQPCKPGNWCPYACPPGQVSMQWNPEATSYTYPLSMVCI